jgi:gas vesicle protein
MHGRLPRSLLPLLLLISAIQLAQPSQRGDPPFRLAIPEGPWSPGDIVPVTASSRNPIQQLQASFANQKISFFPDSQRQQWNALVGIDMQTKPGRHIIRGTVGYQDHTSATFEERLEILPKEFPEERVEARRVATKADCCWLQPNTLSNQFCPIELVGVAGVGAASRRAEQYCDNVFEEPKSVLGSSISIFLLFRARRGFRMETENQKLNGLMWFVAGSLVGTGVALLLAPQSGKRTRRDIVHLGRMAKKKSELVQLEVRHAIDRLVEDISDKMQEGVDRGREWTDTTTRGVVQALNSGKDYIQKEIEKVMHSHA